MRKAGVVEKCTFCYHRTSNGHAAGLRRGLPVQGADLRRPGRSELRDRQGAEGAEVVPPAGGQGHASRTCITSASTAPEPERDARGTIAGRVDPPRFLCGTGNAGQRYLEHGLAREDLCRFLAACYYQPGPEFAEEKVFDSMLAAANADRSGSCGACAPAGRGVRGGGPRRPAGRLHAAVPRPRAGDPRQALRIGLAGAAATN